MNEGFAADFSRVDEDGLVLLLHFVELDLFVFMHKLDVLVEHLDFPLFLVLTLLYVQKLDEQFRAMFYGIYDQIFYESNESFGIEAMLTQYKRNLR